MKQFTYNLDKKLQRPVIVLQNIRILIDTGAKFPIWTSGEQAFINAGGTIDSSKGEVYFSGFGGKTSGILGRINFQLGNIIFPQMPIILNSSTDISADIILGASNFEGMIYQIDTITHKLNIDIPDDNVVRNLAIRSDNGKTTVYLMHNVTQKEEKVKYTVQDLEANHIQQLIKEQNT